MHPWTLAVQEISYRWISSSLTVLLVAAITGTITFFVMNSEGFEREASRNVRDIGSNVVILPADTNQFDYHRQGGFSEKTMPAAVVDQLVEFRASLNRLIPMLERKAICRAGNKSVEARVIGLSASIPIPGRPKAPMQKSIEKGSVQIGSELAKRLDISRTATTATVSIADRVFPVQRVNRSNGTWQDASIFIDLNSAQELFGLADQISRIEAIECTQSKCEETGLRSDVVLTNELAQITDQAVLLRREQMANARLNVRVLNGQNLRLLKNLLWTFLACSMVALAALNTVQRKSEIGLLQAVGFGQIKVVSLFLLRTALLGMVGCIAGVGLGALTSLWQSKHLFKMTGSKLEIDWSAGLLIGAVALALSLMATLIPAILSASRHPADLIGKES